MILKRFAALLALLLALLTALPPLQALAAGPNDPTASGETADPNAEETDPSGTESDPSGTESDPAGTESDPAKEGEEEDTPAAPQINVFDPQMGYPVEDGYRMNGTAALLYDLNTDTMLYTQNPDGKVYPASLTKLTTALVVMDYGNLEDLVTISANAVQSVTSRTGDVKIGETMTLHNLLYCILMSSSNECANAAAEHVAGSIDAFVAKMNEKAAELGCTGTHYANPHGLHDENHYTTARDLWRITKAVLANETLREIVFSTSYDLPATNKQAARTLYTTNYMTSQDQSKKYYYEPAKGIKTGYTSAAGRCLIVTAEKNGMDLLAIVLGCETTEEQNGEFNMHSFAEAKGLFEYGFKYFERVIVLAPSVPIADVPVSGGASSSVVVAPVAEQAATLPKEYAKDQITTEVLLTGSGLQAPVAAGDTVGTVSVQYGGVELSSAEAVAVTDVAAAEEGVFESAAPVPDNGVPEGARTGTSLWRILLILLAVFAVLYIGSRLYIRRVTRVRTRRRSTAGRPRQRAGSARSTGQSRNAPARSRIGQRPPASRKRPAPNKKKQSR